MNRDPLPTNDDAFFASPEPKITKRKWGGRTLGVILLGLLTVSILGNLVRQPFANFIEQLLTPEVKAFNMLPQGYCRGFIGIELNTGRTVIELPGEPRFPGEPRYSDLVILSSDDQQVEQTISKAFLISSGRQDNNAKVKEYSFLLLPHQLKIGKHPSDAEIIAAVKPLLSLLGPYRYDRLRICYPP